MHEAPLLEANRAEIEAAKQPLLSIVVPVYRKTGPVLQSVLTIRESVAVALGEPFELIVVLDGSDELDASFLEQVGGPIRLIQYDRNLGKGYAVKAGALAARGRWIAYIDGDLDLDPSAIVPFLEEARAGSFDIVIGSKRHPESVVEYPRLRRVESWLYQQLVRVLFRLDVRDTQVGLKIFSRDVAERVFPLLLVKRYAFDLELLAVAKAFGLGRIRELPVTLRYRFSGSGVTSLAVLRALVDTAAIFYRLRILHYYRRKSVILAEAGRRTLDWQPLVSVIAPSQVQERLLGYPRVQVIELAEDTPDARRSAAAGAFGEVLAFLGPDQSPAGNWISSALPFLAHPDIAAVVAPTMAPIGGSVRDRAAAAIWESRLGGGSLYFRFRPGNLRTVRDFPGSSMVVRRRDFLAAGASSPDDLCAGFAKAGKRVVYTPETVVVSAPPPLFGPHLARVAMYGRRRGRALRLGRLSALRLSTLPPVGLAAFAMLGWPLLFAGRPGEAVWSALWAIYAGVVVLSGTVAALRFRSLAVAPLAMAGLVATHYVYGVSFLRGLFTSR